ncbi:MAG: NAD-dependent epimerase/dehydratase family protein [Myxococcales bacterium]|jgi:UDP-glucose 4-epimerase|nr:NAD-dependent epimerase/dehydratase family protein [Myxococcales bacterium]
MLRGAHLFITGGAGFIGSALVERFATDNRVTVFDTAFRDPHRHAAWTTHPNIAPIHGDIRDAAQVKQAMRGATHVVHLASIAGVRAVLQAPLDTMEITLQGTTNVLDAAAALPGLSRLVYLSTSEVFGAVADDVRETDDTRLGPAGEPRWAYAAAKLAAEHLCQMTRHTRGLPLVILRPFNIFGPGQWSGGAIHQFIDDALAGRPLCVHNDGTQVRAWCHIDDFVAGLALALQHPDAPGRIFHIGNPDNAISVRDLAHRIADLCQPAPPVRHARRDAADVQHRIPNISLAARVLGFAPAVSLDDGLRRTLDAVRARRDDTRADDAPPHHPPASPRSLPF